MYRQWLNIPVAPETSSGAQHGVGGVASVPRRRRVILILTGLFVLGGLGYWFTTGHPVPTGPMAEQLSDRTWQFTEAGRTTDMRLKADGTLRFGGVQDGTWNITSDRLDLSFAPMWEHYDLKVKLYAVYQLAVHGEVKVSFRILELTADSVTIHRQTLDGEDDPDEDVQTLTLAPP